jgi:PAS domain S-box-containing protein
MPESILPKQHRNGRSDMAAAGFESGTALFRNMISAAAYFEVEYTPRGTPADFRFLDVNPAWEKIISRKRTEAIGRKASELFHGIMPQWLKIAHNVLQSKRGTTFEYHEKETNRWFQVSMYSPRQFQCVLIFNEITELKRAEEKIRSSEEWFRTLLSCASDMIQVVDAGGRMQYLSPSVKRVLGYAPEELIGKPSASVVHPDDLPAVAEGFKNALTYPKKPVYTVCRCRHKNGSWRVLAGMGLNHLDNPRIRGFVSSTRDITRQCETEKELKESEEKVRSIIEQSGDGIVLIDRSGTIIEYNASQARSTGIPRNEALGKKVWDIQYRLFPSEVRNADSYRTHKKKYMAFLKTGSAPWLNTVLEVPMERPDRTTVFMQTVVFPIRFGEGLMFGSVNRDVTGLRKVEKELEEQNKRLQEKNTALREVLAQLENEKQRIGDQVHANVERLVLPLLQKLEARSSEEDKKYLAVVRENLHEITSSFGTRIAQQMHRMTQKEIELCDMIKRGLSSKEIAQLMNISFRTVETHRNRIRKKLGIADPRVNLVTYLKSI